MPRASSKPVAPTKAKSPPAQSKSNQLSAVSGQRNKKSPNREPGTGNYSLGTGHSEPGTSSSQRPAAAEPLLGYEVLVAVCGGIAAYKTATLVSRLVQQGAGVTVAMTASAQEFITPLTFQALTARAVYTSTWQIENPADQQHLALTERADLIIVAPATANTIAKTAAGIADELVSTLLLSAAGPVLMAPAMNTRMWQNKIVQSNVSRLRDVGIQLVGPNAGWLACREIGEGRMSEPEEILERAKELLLAAPPKNKIANKCK